MRSASSPTSSPRTRRPATRGVLRIVSQEPMIGRAALLPIQQQFLAEGGKGREHFNQTVLLETPADFDPRFLRDVVAALYRRHDALRLRFTDAGAEHHEL